jgi:RecB family endonuclease NucS
MDNLVNIECHLKYYEKLTYSGIINIVVPNSEIRIRAIELARVGKKKAVIQNLLTAFITH